MESVVLVLSKLEGDIQHSVLFVQLECCSQKLNCHVFISGWSVRLVVRHGSRIWMLFVFCRLQGSFGWHWERVRRMFSVGSRFVCTHSFGILILPMISCLRFVVLSVVMGVYVAHFVAVVVVRMTWLFVWLVELSTYSCW